MINDQNQKHVSWGITAFAVIAAALFFSFVLEHLGPITVFLGKLVDILMPVIYGAVMAFLMAPTYQLVSTLVAGWLRPGNAAKTPVSKAVNMPVGKAVMAKFRGGSSTKFFTEAERLRKEKNAERIGKMVATFTCIIVILAVLTALIAMLIPQLISGVSDLTNSLPKGANSVSGWIQILFQGKNPELEEMVLEGYGQISDTLAHWISADFMPNLNKYLTQMTSGVMRLFVVLKNFFIGLIVMAYGLNMKEALAAQSKRILYALLPRRVANEVVSELRYVKWVFSSFIVGKIIDSVIIGIICYICMSFMKMPYALLISVFVGVTNVIPFFGPFVGAIPSAFILLMVSPITTLQFLIFILVLQQFDGNILGPRILGSTTGMSSFWVLFSILFFGGLWGIVGMVVGIPTFAVLTRLSERALAHFLRRKKLPVAEECYDNLERIDEEDGSFRYESKGKKH